jgi:hypothetical protein
MTLGFSLTPYIYVRTIYTKHETIDTARYRVKPMMSDTNNPINLLGLFACSQILACIRPTHPRQTNPIISVSDSKMRVTAKNKPNQTQFSCPAGAESGWKVVGLNP